MKEEWFPLVNEKGETIGKATRKECHNGSKMLHPVVHLHIFNKAGDLYLQKRSINKDIQPGKWDTAVGGHIDYGETVEDALHREVREELGKKAVAVALRSKRSYLHLLHHHHQHDEEDGKCRTGYADGTNHRLLPQLCPGLCEVLLYHIDIYD